ncbi:COG4 transport protein-domain-containing protein [Blyttiomyces helicus]|uniref:Conserved oligomeric Golgi complex subunit 4 n=1 Tax=Blyttiomyces helicus TaxID=388810 RepID=A0A4P9WHI8_9FUNG|nr:COG4 transport protein-domain-containing protein [Blyttiomyces helicus]|eukprot:RKO91852.1 COG4 transport protein-domain-containing protein [Blyttiomyces helicus]
MNQTRTAPLLPPRENPALEAQAEAEALENETTSNSPAAPPESLPLQDLQNLTEVEAVQMQLRLLNDEETRVDLELDTVMRNQLELERTLDTLEILRPQVGVLKNDASALLQVISNTSTLAERISDKVRKLDFEQSRVKATIKVVEDIQDLKNCASGVQSALKSKDYEQAGRNLRRFLRFDPSTIDKIFSGDDAYNAYLPSSEAGPDSRPASSTASPVAVLKAAQQTLANVVTDEFDRAVATSNEEGIVRFFKIFPMFGQPEVGLDRFSAYICGIISRQCQDSMKESPDRTPRFYAGLLTRLFETIALVVDRQESMVEAAYGPGRMLRVIQRLQREGDIQSSIILESFGERYQLQRKLGEINRFEGSGGRRNNTAPKPESTIDPRELDAILGEIAIISQRAQQFDRFLRVRGTAEVEKLEKDPTKPADFIQSTQSSKDGLAKLSKLNERVQGLMSNFVAMEEYFVRRSIEKAMTIDEYEPGSLTSSCVDDVFFILKTCSRRAMSTADPDCVCAVINSIGRILELDYINVFQKKLRDAFSNTETKEMKIAFMILLNNIDVSCDYVVKLTQELEHEITRAFSSSSELAREKMRSCLLSLADYANNFRNVLKVILPTGLFRRLQPPFSVPF